ncbi:T9SS type A sorting domain-containing protein [Gelidibacter japonicus]|uniref:T9SS type A sorting domain-containing protein n=1 Tax=Gelidibacter japonicus TaxID=1962232 RepID=UPI002AFEB0A5|nr:T9SS type A sorting domain-containing protein [Gelidibacter japonicus]
MKTKLSFIIVMLMTVTLHAATLRVSTTGDNSDGSSWANAYTTIQAALNAAVSGDEIWVKQGTYIIVSEAEQLAYKEGVNVYGGFTGSETALSQRDANPELTIISHVENGTPDFRLLSSAVLNTATTWDGFTFDGNNVGTGVLLSSNCNLNNTVVVNCAVTDGSGAGVAIVSSENVFGTVNLTNSTIKDNTIFSDGGGYFGGGAGIFVGANSKAALIEDCIISGNTINGLSNGSSVFGAGIFIIEGVIKNSAIDNNKVIGTAAGNNVTGAAIAIVPQTAARKVLIEGCSVTNNESRARGGAILIDPRWSGQFLGDYTISNTSIINNKTTQVGAGILTTAATQQNTGWTLNVINSVIANNSANTGGGMFINSSGTVNVTYSTIVNNNSTANYGGGGINFAGSGNQTINATLTNVLLWGNKEGIPDTGRTQFSNNGQASTIQYSAIQGFNSAYYGWDNATIESIINLDADNATGPKFLAPTATVGFGASDLDVSRWQITDGSAAIETGTDATDNNGNPIITDFAGKARPISSNDFIYPDIGAYQFDASNPPVLGLETIVAQPSEFRIFPTVTTRVLNIKTNRVIRNIEIFNINGSRILKTNATEVIDVSNFTSGMYVFKVMFDDSKTSVKRFIKQ